MSIFDLLYSHEFPPFLQKKKRMPIIRETVEPPLLESNDDNAVVEVGSLNVLNSNFEVGTIPGFFMTLKVLP